MKGTYLLLINLDENIDIGIGKLGKISFFKGWYVYVGSALNNLESRITRHMQSLKKMHWHIDYFLDKSQIITTFIKEGISKEECLVASSFLKIFHFIPQFGCSDCSCLSHLFFGNRRDLEQMICQLGFKPFYS